MSWDNYGNYWHIDHVKPIDSFNFSEENEENEEIDKCFNWKNTRPLEKKKNLNKRNIIDDKIKRYFLGQF